MLNLEYGFCRLPLKYRPSQRFKQVFSVCVQDDGAAPQAQPHAAAAAAQPPPPPAAAQQDQQRLHQGVLQQTAVNGTNVHDADGQPEAEEGQAPGGWVQAVDERAESLSSAKPAPLSNIKFSLKL